MMKEEGENFIGFTITKSHTSQRMYKRYHICDFVLAVSGRKSIECMHSREKSLKVSPIKYLK